MNYFVPKDVKIDCEGDLEIIKTFKEQVTIRYWPCVSETYAMSFGKPYERK